MILSPEEQTEYREEIDYAIETHGYEYVWGKETTMDKVRAFSRDAPGQLMNGINKIVTNPTVIEINEKLKAHAEKMNAQESQEQSQQRNQNRMQEPQYHNPQPRQPRRKKQLQNKHQPRNDLPEDIQFNRNPFGDHPLGNNPLGDHPLNRKQQSRQRGFNMDGDDHL